jgi:hypothetical protein
MSYYYDGDNNEESENREFATGKNVDSDGEFNQIIKEKKPSFRKNISSDMAMDAPNEEELERNPNVWSHSVSVGLKSFVDNR